MSVAWATYRMLAPAVAVLADGAAALAMGGSQARWAERTGRVPRRDGCAAWLHAASLGESLAAGALAHALVARDASARLQLTAMTPSGRARLSAFGHPVSLAPLDAPRPVARFLAAVEPRRLILIETELWPHWLLAARARGIPAAVVSARLSARSLARYARLGHPFRDLVANLAAVLCQTERDAERWRALGALAARTRVTGNLKDDALPPPVADRARARAALGLDPNRPLLVFASLRPGEAARLARAWRALAPPLRDTWQVVAVPRHASAAAGLRGEAARVGETSTWRWDERAGVLAGYYAAADVAFVGGSLEPFGGHNPLEPAAAGSAIMMGSAFVTQTDAVEALRARDAIEIVASDRALSVALEKLLGDPALRASRAAAARAVAEARRGATTRAIDQLAELGVWPVQ